jgi:transcriptional regulator
MEQTMYLPAHFAENRPEVLQALIVKNPLATLVMHTATGLEANHVPLQFVPPTAAAPHGLLRGHVARANALWKTAQAENDVLVIFQGPHAYISPSWYPGKADHARIVPTWNYVAVHARGLLVVKDDPVWLREFLGSLTTTHETEANSTWRMEDAPDDYIAKMLNAIVGFEITITALQGKWKVSQNKSVAERAGMVQGLQHRANSNAVAVAELISKLPTT